MGGPRSDLELAVALATGASNVAWRHQQRMLAGADDLAVGTKSNPTDVVTAADTEAEAWLVEQLALARPEDSVLGEEGARREGTSGRTWVVDPVDGTYNFVRGWDRWCTALALVDGTGPLLSAISQPRTSRVWAGGPAHGVRENRSEVAPLADRPLAGCSLLTYLHPSDQDGPVGDVWRAVAGQVATLRMTGSGSLDAADVIAGRADLVLQHSVPDWDRLPGEAMIRALGGAALVVPAGGRDWYLAGPSRAVAEAADLLRAP